MTDFWTMVGAGATAMTPIILAQVAFTKVLIDKSISRANADLLKQINGTYVRTTLCKADQALVQHRLTQLENEN